MYQSMRFGVLIGIGAGLVSVPAVAESDYSEADVRTVYADACGAHGIDPPKCTCILDTLLARHSIDALLANGFDMVLRYDEASALMSKVGEQAVWTASEDFDILQNQDCSGAAQASSPSNNGAGSAAGAAEGAVAAE